MENIKITLDNPQGEYVFSNYGEGFLAVNHQTLNNSVLIYPDRLEAWPVTTMSELTADHFDAFIERRPDVLIFGTGVRQHFPSIELRRELAKRNVQMDVMDTPAACRTYNLLVSEDRNVAAAVLLM
ncbi:MAG: Mth938-like domain-containing protein [Pseudomonadota bacterium]